ncbi:MAG: regulatory protein RecX [Deltaproteobacteria bacterium]|nr:regulatory protein RecX [Deltaproteobacteria bacterium]
MSEEEIRGKLEKKGYPGGEAESVVARLRELGLADDSGLCGRLAAQYRETRGYGPAKIAWTLKRRGFPRDLVEETVRRSFPGEDELEAAAAALRKKFRGVPPPGREGAVRAYRFLAGRGFSPGVCRMAAGRWMKDFLEGED